MFFFPVKPCQSPVPQSNLLFHISFLYYMNLYKVASFLQDKHISLSTATLKFHLFSKTVVVSIDSTPIPRSHPKFILANYALLHSFINFWILCVCIYILVLFCLRSLFLFWKSILIFYVTRPLLFILNPLENGVLGYLWICIQKTEI